MPALLAYLVALAVFLGGSYEALTWLAAPEPMKIVRAKHKAKLVVSESELDPVAAPSAQSASIAREVAEPNVEKQPSQSAAEVKTDPAVVSPRFVADPHNAPISPASAVSSVQAQPSSSQSNLKEHSSRRFRVAHASISPSRKLKLMTLETIEFADGRRANRLVPYRGEARALAFSAEW